MSRSRRFTFDTTVGRREAEVRVTYEVSPLIPATYWQPAEGGEVEIVRIGNAATGMAVFLSQDEEDALLKEAEERAEQDCADEDAAEADWRYQEFRDRQLMEAWERSQ